MNFERLTPDQPVANNLFHAMVTQPRFQVRLTSPFQLNGQVLSCEVKAVADPNRVYSRISTEVAAGLNAYATLHRRTTILSDGTVNEIVGPIVFEMLGRKTIDEALVCGDGVTIGRAVLSKTDLVVTANGEVIPNPAHPNGPVLRV